jgi:hypothetical protein
LLVVGIDIAHFVGGVAFQYIEYKSGIGWVHRLLNNLTGAAEVAAGILILYRTVRGYGARDMQVLHPR